MSNKLKRNLDKKAAAANHEQIAAVQIPVVLNRDVKNIIGFVALDPTRMPKGTDWGLQPGVDKDDNLILFSTIKKAQQPAGKE